MTQSGNEFNRTDEEERKAIREARFKCELAKDYLVVEVKKLDEALEALDERERRISLRRHPAGKKRAHV